MQLIKGDCLEVMKDIPDKSIDAVITDMPYGMTACKWDSVIPLDKAWECIKRVRKERTPIVFFGSQPFTTTLISSNIKEFRYEWIWDKCRGANFATLKYAPFKEHENIIVFSKNAHNYFPIMEERSKGGVSRVKYAFKKTMVGEAAGGSIKFHSGVNKCDPKLRNPKSIQSFDCAKDASRGIHPTLKPLALMEYLVKTYSKEGDTVLDFAMGSGTTGVACKKLNRKFIGIEIDDKYFNIAKKRIEETKVEQ